jgi:amino acid adenylation domain-containing protein
MIAPQPVCTLAELLQNAADRWGERTAVVDGNLQLTYSELLKAANDHCSAIRELGVEAGDRVGILLGRSAAAVAAWYGVAFAGGVVVPVSDRLKLVQVGHLLADARASAVITDERHAHLLDGSSARRILISNGTGPGAALELAGGRERVRAIGRDLAALLYSSGSTGRPKGIMVTHENLLWGAAIVAAYLELSAEDRLALALPLSFDYGLNQVLSAAVVGARIVIERSSHPAALCRTMEREGVTGLAGVPFLWQQLTARHSPFLALELPRLRYLTNTGGGLAPAIVERIRQAKPNVRLYLMYGLTEAFRSTCLDPAEVDRRPGSIGRPIANTEILVISEDGRLCAAGEVGELVHRGPTVAAGYWGDPQATARTFRASPLDPEGLERVVYSGDLVRSDDCGYLYFVGRRDGLFKSRGIRVNAEEVEVELRRCAEVADAVAFSEEVAAGGDREIVVAYVPTAAGTGREAVERFCRSELPVHLRPVRVHEVAEIPRTAHDKPDRLQAAATWGGGLER